MINKIAKCFIVLMVVTTAISCPAVRAMAAPVQIVPNKNTENMYSAATPFINNTENSYLSSLHIKMDNYEEKVNQLYNEMQNITKEINDISIVDLYEGVNLDEFRQKIDQEIINADKVKGEMKLGSEDYSGNITPNNFNGQNNKSVIESVLTSNNVASVLSRVDAMKSVSDKEADIIAKIIEHRKAIDSQIDSIKSSYNELKNVLDQLEIEQNSLKNNKNYINFSKDEMINKLIDEEIEKQDEKYSNISLNSSSYAEFTFPCPSYTEITCGFGEYEGHSGCDFSTNGKQNQKIVAAESGTVIIAKNLDSSYGHYIVIKHDKTTPTGQVLYTLYAHNNKLLVCEGDYVEKGELIAYSGTTGNSTGPHCHFEIRLGGPSQAFAVDPSDWLS